MKNRILVTFAAALLASGCASTKMIDSPQQELVPPAAGKAQVVFMRASFVGSAVQAVIYDATGGSAEFIGIISNGKKLAYSVDPGQHVFMVVSEAADFLEADLAGGKTYYAMVTPRMGAWKARFSLSPVRNGGEGDFQYQSDKFQGWLRDNKFSENTAESNAWAVENHSSVLEKQARYWPAWQEKSATDIAERTLNPDDGV